MQLRELNPEEQSFATENHNLIYAFLRDKRLTPDDYYDVIVFGYLHAVQKYLICEDLRRQYAFSTIAWQAMERDLNHHFKSQSRPMRRGVTINLDSAPYSNLCDIDKYRLMEQIEARILWNEAARLLSEAQIEALHMRADGYSTREIAAARKTPLREIEEILASALESVRAFCQA